MSFRQVVLFAAVSSLSFSHRGARAQAPQGMGPSTPLPLVVELKSVPVGSWSEYRIADGKNNLAIRMALVTRSARSVNVETRIQGGPVAALGETTVRMSLPLDGAAVLKPTEQVIQLGGNPPMFLPVDLGGATAQSFKKLDPKKRLGADNVVVAAGTFPRADHYQEKGAAGETIDFWVSKKVLPFGLIKVSSAPSGGGAAVTMELTAQGGGAKPAITKTPQPFDAATIMKQAQPAMAGDAAAGKGGPPARPIPSPHPGMPPTVPGSTAGPGAGTGVGPSPAKNPAGGKGAKSEK